MSIAKNAKLPHTKLPQTTRSAATTQVSRSFLNYTCVVPIFLSWLLFWGMGGSGSQKTPLMAGHDTPGARGAVSTKVGANMNTAVDLKVESLAQPDTLTPPANAYVVWVQPPGDTPKNEGQIRVGVKENGELHTEVPYKRFRIFITAEQNPQTQTPTGPQVLSGEIAGP